MIQEANKKTHGDSHRTELYGICSNRAEALLNRAEALLKEQKRQIEKFPVLFPVSREFDVGV